MPIVFLSPDAQFLNVLLTSILIFFARVVDVGIGTMRIICISKGRRYLAPALGFVEILIWLVAIGQVMRAGFNPFYFAAFAGGFALGNFVGIFIEEKLALGTLVVCIITSQDATQLIEHLHSRDIGVTSIDAQGKHGQVKMLYTIIKRRHLGKVVSIINKYNPKAFYSVEEVQAAKAGIFPDRIRRVRRRPFDFLRMMRKSK